MNKLQKRMVSKHREWREIQMVAIKAVEIGLRQKLLAEIPDSLKFYFSEEARVIPEILEFGEVHRRYTDEDCQTFGFDNYKAFRNQLYVLAKAWAGVVKISSSRNDPGRYDVKFTTI